MLDRTILIIIIITTCFCNGPIFNWTMRFSLTNQIKQIEYSWNQKYVAMAGYSKIVYLSNGAAIFPYETAQYTNSPYLFNSLAISSNQQFLAIGFQSMSQNSIVYLYNISQSSSPFLLHKQPNKAGKASIVSVTSMCWTLDSQKLIYGTSDGRVYCFDWKTETTMKYFFLDSAQVDVACSPTKNSQFIVATSGQIQDSRLVVFQIGQYLINLVREIEIPEPRDMIYGLCYTPSGDEIYRSTSRGVYVTTLSTYETKQITIPQSLSKFRKVKVGGTGDTLIMAVTTEDNTLYIQKSTNGVLTQQVQLTNSTKFGLTRTGTNLLFFNNNMQQSMSRCLPAYYLDLADNICKKCNITCSICLLNSQTCHSCRDTYYLTKENKCQSCSDRCKYCTNQKHCYQCYDPFVVIEGEQNICECPNGSYIIDKTCGLCKSTCKTCMDNETCSSCKKGMYLNLQKQCINCSQNCLSCTKQNNCVECAQDFQQQNDQCQPKRNFPVWAIVLIVIISVTIPIIVSVIIIQHIRKLKRKENQNKLLSSNSDEEIASRNQ